MDAKTIKVPVETLADLYPNLRKQFGFTRPFLKMDTKGFDLQCAIGAGDTLKQFIGLQSEVSFSPIYAGSPTFEEVTGYYKAQDFVMSRLFPNNGGVSLQLVEMDVVLVRSDQLLHRVS